MNRSLSREERGRDGGGESQNGRILGRGNRGLRGPNGNAKESGAWVTKVGLSLGYHLALG